MAFASKRACCLLSVLLAVPCNLDELWQPVLKCRCVLCVFCGPKAPISRFHFFLKTQDKTCHAPQARPPNLTKSKKSRANNQKRRPFWGGSSSSKPASNEVCWGAAPMGANRPQTPSRALRRLSAEKRRISVPAAWILTLRMGI